MKYAANREYVRNPGESFIPANDWLLVILLTFIGSFLNYIPYNNTMSYLVQGSLLGGIFLLYKSRPIMMIVAYIILTILPSRADRGFTEITQGIYSLNPQICIVFTLLFVAYGLIVLKRSYRLKLAMLFFVIFMIASLVWTVSLTFYNKDFWWMCTAYIFLPMFIDQDNDLRLILTSFIVSVDVFCIKVLPILVSNTDLYRGSVYLDPNYAAFYILISVALVVVTLTQYESVLSHRFKLFAVASVVLSIITMAYFASRTSFIMLAFLVILYLQFNFRRLKTLLLSLGGIILFYLILNQYGAFNAVLLRFGADNTSTAGGRLIIQQALLDAFTKYDLLRILFGNGYLTTSNFGLGLQAHNTYVSILIGFGLIGLTIYIVYLIGMFAAINKSAYQPFLIVFYLLCVYGFSLEPYHMIEGIIFFCMLAGISNLDTRPVINSDGHIEGVK